MPKNIKMFKILFITSNRLGDAVLSTGILDYLGHQYPDAQITVACGPLAEGLFKSASGVVEVVVLRKKPFSGHWLELWQKCIGTKWGIIVDLRNSAVSRLLWAGQRYIWGKTNPALHKVEQNAQVLGLTKSPAPRLWFSAETLTKARQLIPDGNFTLAIGPTANWKGKTWPAENFIELIIRLRENVFKNCRVAIFAAPGEEEDARKVLQSIPAPFAIDVIAKADPVTVAAAISLCQFYIGNDSGLMHCSAATGVPTLGLFGPSRPEHYRPWGANSDYVATPQTMDELIAFPGYNPKTVGSLMGTLSIDAVYEAIRKMGKTSS